MRLRAIRWANYRRLPDGFLRARNHLVLVGPNDSGKSSVLRAINLCLGIQGSQVAPAVQPRDFTRSDEALLLEVVLGDFSDMDRAAFPDEITTGSPETLTVRLEARLDPNDPDNKQVRRDFPESGHSRGPTRSQLEAFGWAYIPAARSLLRELGQSAGGAVHSILSTLDLSSDAQALQAAADEFRVALESSTALKEFRGDLAAALTAALPRRVNADDLRVSTAAELADDPLAGVSLSIRDGDHTAPLADQSDGIRALSVLTLIGMSQRSARIVGIDEPETHLHTTAQRAVARSLRRDGDQRVLVTHSAAVVSEMHPLDIVAFRHDGRARQLPDDAAMNELETATRFWSPTLIEPLTARRVILVEGASDRILCEGVAELLGLDLNRAGVALFEMDGSGLFGIAYRLFGPPGFDIPLYGLVDEDARAQCARDIGVRPSELEQGGYVVCDPDLEGVYVKALGFARVAELLLASGTIPEKSLLQACNVGTRAALTDETLAVYCRHKKRKVRTALALATGMTVAEARTLAPIVDLLERAAG